MEYLKSLDVEELSTVEMQEVEGGLIALLMSAASLCIAAYGAGYVTGKAIF